MAHNLFTMKFYKGIVENDREMAIFLQFLDVKLYPECFPWSNPIHLKDILSQSYNASEKVICT